jgi:hypothetical protein
VPFGLREEEDQGDDVEGKYSNVEPPEVTPADGLSHGTGNDGADHEGAKVGGEVAGVVLATVVQEEQVSNDSRVNSLGRTSTETIETSFR